MRHWISFPALNWTFSLPQSLVTFSLFGHTVDIRFYGVCIALGFLLAVVYACCVSKKLGVNRDRLLDVVLVSAVAAIIGARLYYVIFYDWAGYMAHPAKIFAIWDGGLAIYGGLIGAFLCAPIMCRLRKVHTLAVLDLASLGFLIGQAIGRWGNFFNQEAYGGNTTLPWGMTGDIIQTGAHGVVADQTAPVHPTFLYESLWCALGFLVLHLLSKRLFAVRGQTFACYLIWYGLGRAWIEALRSDSLMLGPVKVSQLVAVLSVFAGAALLVFLRKRAAKPVADTGVAPGPAEEIKSEAEAQPQEPPPGERPESTEKDAFARKSEENLGENSVENSAEKEHISDGNGD